MTYPDSPQVLSGDGRVVMVALARIMVADLAERLADIQPGSCFWARLDGAAGLIAAGQAAYAPAGTPWPLAEPPWTARGVAGAGRGTTNSSR
jgi:hypothetical protein